MPFIKISNKSWKFYLGVILIFLFSASTLLARTLFVGPNHNVKNLKNTIQIAKDGDTILLDGGYYNEGNLIIDKNICLIGKNLPVLDGAFKYEILTISGDHIAISGIKFINCGASAMNDFASIKCIDATNILLSNNVIIDSYFGIHVSNSSNIKIVDNIIVGSPKTEQNCGNGIHLWKCNHIIINDNQVRGHRDGIYLEFVTESMIQNNFSSKNIRYGLHFMFSHKNAYICNTFKDNGAGVAVMYSHEVQMEQNTFENNWGASAYGILLKDISDSKIYGNFFIKNTVGIYMEGSSRIIVMKNLFKENGWALKVQASCDGNSFLNNNFFGNSFDVSTNGTMTLNTFSENYWDKYEGYDLAKDGFGDIPYHPVNLFSMIVEQNPSTLILLRSILISFLDKAEKAIPSLTPENLFDKKPLLFPNIL